MNELWIVIPLLVLELICTTAYERSRRPEREARQRQLFKEQQEQSERLRSFWTNYGCSSDDDNGPVSAPPVPTVTRTSGSTITKAEMETAVRAAMNTLNLKVVS